MASLQTAMIFERVLLTLDQHEREREARYIGHTVRLRPCAMPHVDTATAANQPARSAKRSTGPNQA